MFQRRQLFKDGLGKRKVGALVIFFELLGRDLCLARETEERNVSHNA